MESQASCSSTGTSGDIRDVVSKGGDIVFFLLKNKFSNLDFNEKIFVCKLKPCPEMKNLVVCNIRGNSRAFNKNWYNKSDWLTGSETTNKLYCWNCLLLNEKTKTPWNSTGYADLKHISTSLQKHGQSEEHTHASLKLKLIGKQNQTIQSSLNSAYRQTILKHNETVKENRDIIQRLIDMIIYLATQEQAFRGHDESRNSSNQGNFKELASLLSKFDDKFKHFLDQSSVFSGLSKTIQNELIDSINTILSQIISEEIKDSPCFSWQVDETTDIQCLSQLSVIFRYVTKGKLVERFMGFFDVSKGRKATDLFEMLTNKFQEFDLTNKLISQTYDGASVMSGELNGLQSKIKSVAPQALFVHCCAHRMNLILQDSAIKIKECRMFFANVNGLSAFFSKSTKRTRILDESGCKRIPRGADTRWHYKSRIINVIKTERPELLKVFDYILDSDDFTDQESLRAADGFKKMLEDFTFLFLLNTFHLVFEQTDFIFGILQSKFSDVMYCKNRIENLLINLNNLRQEDSHFDKIYNNVCDTIGPPTKKRKTDHDAFSDSKIYFRRLYNEILDLIINQIKVRFTDFESLVFLDLLDKNKFISFKAKFPCHLINVLLKAYPKLFTKNKLQNELQVWYSDSDIFGASSNYSDIVEFIYSNGLQNDVPEIYKLLCVALSIPATSASVERSFSALKRIKTFSRNSMGQSRLNNVATIAIERGLVKLMQDSYETSKFYDKIIDHFALNKNRRIDLIYKEIV